MANAFLTVNEIANEALALLRSNLVVPLLFSRRYEADLNAGSKVGDTIRLRRRSQGVVDEYNGSSITVRDITETSHSVVLEKHFDASIKVTDKEMTLSIKDFSEQVLAPRIVEMGEKVDAYGLGKLLAIPNVAGPSEAAPAALPASISAMALVEKTLNDLKVPNRPRYQIASSLYKATILGVDSFTEVDKRGDTDAMEQARINMLFGFDTFMAQNVDSTTFTTGTQTSAVTNGAVAAGATSIVYDGAAVAAGTLKENDIITIAGYGKAVIAADSVATASAGTLTIKEPLREAVADGVAFTVYDGGGNTRQCHGAVFHPDCLAFIAVPLAQPTAAPSRYVQDPETGLSLRLVFDYDRDLKSDVLSIDLLCGAEMIDGRLGAQVVLNI